MEKKTVKVIIRDKNTLVLDEDAKKGDIIDLRVLEEVDTSSIEKAIEEHREQVYQKKLQEQEKLLNSRHESELHDLENQIASLKKDKENSLILKEKEVKDEYETKINELEKNISVLQSTAASDLSLKEKELDAKYQKEIFDLQSKISSLTKDRENDLAKAKAEQSVALATLSQEKDKEYQSLKSQFDTLQNTFDEKLKSQEISSKAQYDKDISELQNQLKETKDSFGLTLQNRLLEAESKYQESLHAKDDMIADLKRERSARSVKVQGENLETWCNNEVISYMQNGLTNCTWTKDNDVVKEEGESKGSKADYIFRIYPDEKHEESQLLSSVCMDMKSEDPNSTNRKKNSDYYKQLDKNRTKKNCRYAVLVSELELDNPNDIPIFKVLEYPDMYVVRPNYLMTFLNMITSLTTRFSHLVLAKQKEDDQFRLKEDILSDFESIKNTYLDKPLESLKKNLEEISKSNDAIRKANLNIDATIGKITSTYINQIEDKISRFDLALNRDLKKMDKLSD